MIDLSKVPILSQSQESLTKQLGQLICVANRLGLYDAAGAIKGMAKINESEITFDLPWPESSSWPIILQEDDCAPDAKESFEADFFTKTGMKIGEFQSAARFYMTDHGMCSHYFLNDMELSNCGDDPFLTLRCKPQTPPETHRDKFTDEELLQLGNESATHTTEP